MGRLNVGRRQPATFRYPDSAAPGVPTGLPVPAAAQGADIIIVGNRDYKPVTSGVERRYLDAS